MKNLLTTLLAVIIYVSGTDTIIANVSGVAAISSVTLTLDGAALGTGTVSPTDPTVFTFSWNTTTVADGSHVLVATATDTTGNTGSQTANVVVQNHPKVVLGHK